MSKVDFLEADIGDKKPSQFMRYLKSLCPGCGDVFIKYLWMRRLPTEMRMILVAKPEKSLDDLADIADAIMEVMKDPERKPTPEELFNKQIETLSKEFDKLKGSVQEFIMHANIHNRGRSSSRGKPRNRSQSRVRFQDRGRSQNREPQRRGRSSSRTNGGRAASKARPGPSQSGGSPIEKWCWYHIHYGIRAHRCTEPCTF